VPNLHDVLQQIPQQIVIGLTQGSIYALIALGYTLVYGVLRLINFAHGDVYMLGAYAGLFAATRLGLAGKGSAADGNSLVLIVAVFLVAMALCAVAGVAIERLAYRPLRDQPRLAALITAIAVSMLLEYGGQAVFGPTPRPFPALIPSRPLLKAETFTISLNQVVIVLVALGLMCSLTFIVLKTRLGRAMRAVSMDRSAAALMGINTNVIITFTFALGSALAAAGGVLGAVYQSKIDPMMGLMVGLKAFVAAVLGGIGSIPGAAVGGLIMGLAETGVVVVGKSQYQDAIAFAVLILVLLFRPAGIMGKTAPEKV
jgi:branched-chain amino acid transport system permease protein